jgi:threonine aldolase
VSRLPEDHARAKQLAESVAQRWPSCGLDPAAVTTNIVTFHHDEPDKLLDYLQHEGVLAGTIDAGVVRLVTHHDVDDAGLTLALRVLEGAPV